MSFRAKFDLEKTNPLNLIIGLVILAAVFYGIFKLAQFIFSLLYYLAPVLLIATLILDISVVKDYVKGLANLTKRSAPLGIGAIVLSLVFIPVPIAYLFLKALMKRQVKKHVETQRRIKEGDLVDFEELESRPLQKREVSSQNDDIV